MKKLITLLSFVAILPLIANAQRSVDLELTMADPAGNLNMIEGTYFTLNASIKNLGTDTVILSDEIKVQLLLNNVPSLIVNGGNVDSFMRYSQQVLYPGDSFLIVSSPIFTNLTGTFSFCIKASFGINSSTPVSDPDLTNNESCANIHVIPLSVPALSTDGGVKFYPVPADNVLNWEVNNDFKIAQVAIYDLQGKVMYNRETKEQKGQITTRELAAGVYILKITDVQQHSVVKQITIE